MPTTFLTDVPTAAWSTVRHAYRSLRKAFFTTPKPTGAYWEVDAPVDDIERALGERGYAPNWEFSYHYKSEDLNLARVFYEQRPEYPAIDWWQVHVRGWETTHGTVELRAHYEPEPTSHPHPHLNGTGSSVGRGMAVLGEVIDAEGWDVVSSP